MLDCYEKFISSGLLFRYPRVFSFNLTHVGLTAHQGYNFTEIFDGQYLGNYKPDQNFTCTTNPPGIYLVKATPLKQTNSKFSSKQPNSNLKMKPSTGTGNKMEKKG